MDYLRTGRVRGVVILIAVGVLCFCSGVLAQGQRISLSDLTNLVDLSDPQISPDGKQVVLVASRWNFEENHYDSQLVLVEIATHTQRVLTFERPDVQHPRWSKDGRRIAFLDMDKQRKHQVFVMPMSGGDPKRITGAPLGVRTFSWRPDGKEIAFVAEDEPPERTGEEKHNKSFEVGDNVYLAKSASLPSHIWLVSGDGGAAKRMTSGIEGVSGQSSLEWTPAGDAIAFVSQPLPHSGQAIYGSIKMLDVAAGSLRTMVSGFPAGSSPSFSPDGRFLAFARSRGREPSFNPPALFMIPAAGGKEVPLTPDIDRNVSGSWLPDGKAMLVTAPDRTRVSAWVQPVGGAPRKLDLGPIDASAISVCRDGGLAFIGVEPQRPAELYYMKSIDSRPDRLTDFNAVIASRHLGKVETVTWKGTDGFEEDGVVIYPPDFSAGRKYPLVLNIHGGPAGTSTEGFTGRGGLFNHSMAAKDWIVFMPNYRGSNNMGQAFQHAVVNDAGEGPGRDVMAGIAALKARGIIDESRMAVSGWSYGGYMTVWLTGHYQGWAAAVSGAAVTDWFDWYDLADMNVWSGYGLGGSPWLNDNQQGYWKQSPITYAPKIRTPTLILHDVDDPRVTVTQSYKLYHALKDNGVTVQFIAYPVAGHSPPDPVHQRDVYRRWIDWIDRQFAAAPAR